jgi:hypothetical protein
VKSVPVHENSWSVETYGVLLARIGWLAILEPSEAGVFPVQGAQAVEIEPLRAAVGLMLAVVFAGSAVALLRLDRDDDSDTPR